MGTVSSYRNTLQGGTYVGRVDHQVVRVIGTEEPITLEELKAYFRIRNTEEDTLLITPSIIPNARRTAEKFINSDIISRQRRTSYSYIEDEVNLYGAPIASVDSVTQEDNLGDIITLVEGTGYEIVGLDNPIIRILSGGTERVTITYTTTGITGPELDEIKSGILAIGASRFYGRTSKIDTNWKAWLTPFKIFGYYGVR